MTLHFCISYTYPIGYTFPWRGKTMDDPILLSIIDDIISPDSIVFLHLCRLSSLEADEDPKIRPSMTSNAITEKPTFPFPISFSDTKWITDCFKFLVHNNILFYAMCLLKWLNAGGKDIPVQFVLVSSLGSWVCWFVAHVRPNLVFNVKVTLKPRIGIKGRLLPN